MAAHQAPPSLGFSRQAYWSGCHFLLQCMKVKSESEVTQSCPTLFDPMDCSLPGSSVHGIFQARVLEWGAIAFSSTAVWTRKYQHRLIRELGKTLGWWLKVLGDGSGGKDSRYFIKWSWVKMIAQVIFNYQSNHMRHVLLLSPVYKQGTWDIWKLDPVTGQLRSWNSNPPCDTVGRRYQYQAAGCVGRNPSRNYSRAHVILYTVLP